MEKFSVSFFHRILPCFLVVLLLVPVILGVPASAVAAGNINYNGYYAPPLPEGVSPDEFCIRVSRTGQFSFVSYSFSLLPYIPEFSVNAEGLWGYTIPANAQAYNTGGASSLDALQDISSWTQTSGSPTLVFFSLKQTNLSSNGTYIIFSTDTIYNQDGSVFLEGKSYPGTSSSVPDFTVNQSWDSSQVYAYQEETTADSFTVTASAVGWNTSYQWFYGSSQGGAFSAMPAETLSTFTPKTTAEYLGTSVYYCAVTLTDGSTGESKTVNSGYLTVQVTEVEPPPTDPGGGGGDGGGDDPGTSSPDYSEKLDDISTKLEDVSSAITDSTDQIIDTLNPETPELDDSLSGIDSDLNDVTSFEDDQIADINDNAHVITDSFVVLGNGSSLAAAFSFVSGILTGTFNELGIIQSVFILPLTIGLFLFLCSRVRGFDRPVRKDISNEYLRDSQRSMDGPADFRSSSLYDSDRDKSPL